MAVFSLVFAVAVTLLNLDRALLAEAMEVRRGTAHTLEPTTLQGFVTSRYNGCARNFAVTSNQGLAGSAPGGLVQGDQGVELDGSMEVPEDNLDRKIFEVLGIRTKVRQELDYFGEEKPCSKDIEASGCRETQGIWLCGLECVIQ